jgi:hypothetical protein
MTPWELVNLARSMPNPLPTLDGEPAIIAGALLPFAQVHGPHGSVEFAWETVERILTRPVNPGAFRA